MIDPRLRNSEQRLLPTSRKWLSLTAIAVLAAIVAGCGQRAKTAEEIVPPTAGQPLPYTIVQAEPTPTGAQQLKLYHVVSSLPPAPTTHSSNRRYLHLVRNTGSAYLVDRDGDRYHACRDRSGHLYPGAWDPAAQQYVPLYYDSDRDHYYSVARDGSYYYRSYADDPDYEGCYYQDPNINYDNYAPPSYDEPVIYASGYVYPYQTGYGDPYASYGDGDYGDYAVYHSHHEDWLWSIPVIAVAYLLLEPHHHDNHDRGWTTDQVAWRDNGRDYRQTVNNYFVSAPPHPIRWQNRPGQPRHNNPVLVARNGPFAFPGAGFNQPNHNRQFSRTAATRQVIARGPNAGRNLVPAVVAGTAGAAFLAHHRMTAQVQHQRPNGMAPNRGRIAGPAAMVARASHETRMAPTVRARVRTIAAAQATAHRVEMNRNRFPARTAPSGRNTVAQRPGRFNGVRFPHPREAARHSNPVERTARTNVMRARAPQARTPRIARSPEPSARHTRSMAPPRSETRQVPQARSFEQQRFTPRPAPQARSVAPRRLEPRQAPQARSFPQERIAPRQAPPQTSFRPERSFSAPRPAPMVFHRQNVSPRPQIARPQSGPPATARPNGGGGRPQDDRNNRDRR